jgi:hypothetical protein
MVLLALCTFIGTRSIVSTQREEKERSNMHLANTNTKPKPLAAAAAALWMPARYTLDDDLSNRSARFPSIEERVRVYTSDWYAPPCSNDQKLRYRYSHVPTSTSTPPSASASPCTRMSANNSSGNNSNTATLTNNPSKTIELVVLFHSHKDENETSLTSTTTTTLHIPSTVAPDELFVLTYLHTAAATTTAAAATKISSKAAGSRIPNCALYPNMQPYCQDVEKTLWPALERTFPSLHGNNINNMTMNMNMTSTTTQSIHEYEMPPVLLQFGDTAFSFAYTYTYSYSTVAATDTTTTTECRRPVIHLPVVKKFRRARTREQVAQTTDVPCRQISVSALQNVPHSPEPIIWKLNTARHYNKLKELPSNDISWDEKVKVAVFRGILTGKLRRGHHGQANDDYTVCQSLDRCRLVYNFFNSTLLSARLTNTFGRVNQTIQGVEVQTNRRLSLAEMLKFKGIVILEGNDVASGLKWALASRSVVLMPRPMYTSWAMEELLEPWVHYIPLAEDLADVEEKIQWMIDNDEQAHQIADRGAFWMVDLVIHPDAAGEEVIIEQEILRRYGAHFAKWTSE